MEKTKSDLVTTYVGSNIIQPSLQVSGSSGKGLEYNYYEGVVATVDNIRFVIKFDHFVENTHI